MKRREVPCSCVDCKTESPSRKAAYAKGWENLTPRSTPTLVCSECAKLRKKEQAERDQEKMRKLVLRGGDLSLALLLALGSSSLPRS